MATRVRQPTIDSLGRSSQAHNLADSDASGTADLDARYRTLVVCHRALARLTALGAPPGVLRNERRRLRAAARALVETPEIAAFASHLGFESFTIYLNHIVGIQTDVPAVRCAAALDAA